MRTLAPRGWLAIGAGLLLSGCVRGLLSPEVESPVEVRAVTARFPSDGRGSFGLELEVHGVGTPAELTGLSWEILLGGRWFAAGVRPLSERLPAQGTARLALELPVAFDHPVTPGPTSLDVGVRGHLEARLGGEVRRWSFRRRLSITSEGAPGLGIRE